MSDEVKASTSVSSFIKAGITEQLVEEVPDVSKSLEAPFLRSAALKLGCIFGGFGS